MREEVLELCEKLKERCLYIIKHSRTKLKVSYCTEYLKYLDDTLEYIINVDPGETFFDMKKIEFSHVLGYLNDNKIPHYMINESLYKRFTNLSESYFDFLSEVEKNELLSDELLELSLCIQDYFDILLESSQKKTPLDYELFEKMYRYFDRVIIQNKIRFCAKTSQSEIKYYA